MAHMKRHQENGYVEPTIEALSQQLSEQGTLLHRLFDIVAANTRAEKVEQITGLVVGRRTDGQPTAWLYGPDHLQYKLATVWVENFEQLPLDLAGYPQWPSASPPVRSEAVESPFWVELECEIVLEATGKTTASGRAVYEFTRILGGEEQTSQTTTASAPPSVDALRARAVRAESPEVFAGAALDLFGSTFETVEKISAFVKYVAADGAVVYPALLVAAEMFAAALVMGLDRGAAAAGSRAVYAAAASAMTGGV